MDDITADVLITGTGLAGLTLAKLSATPLVGSH